MYESIIFITINLDTLALILKNRTFRLSPLSNMDDKQEQMTQESIDLGKYIFVSCWTKAKQSLSLCGQCIHQEILE